ncbi:hypothetical protein D9M69_731410 [compost metagenome]
MVRENQLYLYETNNVQDARNKRVQLTGIEPTDAVSRGKPRVLRVERRNGRAHSCVRLEPDRTWPARFMVQEPEQRGAVDARVPIADGDALGPVRVHDL